MRNRKVLATLAVVALVALAGCASFIGGDNTSPSTETPDSDSPEPYAESGANLNETKLLNSHETNLRDNGSFTVNQNITIESDESMSQSAMSMNGTYKVDFDQSTYLEATDTSLGTMTKFTTENATYVKRAVSMDGNETVQYEKAEKPYKDSFLAVQPVEPGNAIGTKYMEGVVANTTYTQNGVEQYNGVDVTRFTADEPSDLQTINETELVKENVTIDAYESALLVTSDGTIRYYSFTLEFTQNNSTSTIQYEAEYTDVGSTTIEDPAWLDKAENQTASA